MRVLLTTDTVGGVWTFTRELAFHLLRRGHTLALVSFGREPSPSQTAWADEIAHVFPNRFAFTSSPAPLEWMPDNARALADGAPVLQNVIGTFGPELLHLNQFCFGALPISVHAATPKLVSAHSDVLSWAETCRPQGFEPSPWLETYVSLVQAGLAGADAVTAPTHWMAAALRRHFPFGPQPQVIPNGRTLPSPPSPRLPSPGPTSPGPTPPNLPSPNSTSPGARKLQAVSAGRLWDEAKNIILLTRITSPLPLVIAGESNPSHGRAPEPAGHRVQFTGMLPEAELLTLFRESSLYIATSIYEPFGLAPLEAALCGCAVLANDIPSLREVWGDAALYFHDGPTLEALLHEMASNPARLSIARQRSLARAGELTSTRMADAYLALYTDLIERSKPTVPLPPALHCRSPEAAGHAA